MNAKKRPSINDLERLEESVFASTVEVCEDNNAMMFVALSEEFGFGHERFRRLIDRFNVVSQKYTDYRSDGYTDEEIHQKHIDDLNRIGIDPEQVYTGTKDFYEVKLRKRRHEKNTTPTFAEAAFMQANMKAFKSLSQEEKTFNYKKITGDIG